MADASDLRDKLAAFAEQWEAKVYFGGESNETEDTARLTVQAHIESVLRKSFIPLAHQIVVAFTSAFRPQETCGVPLVLVDDDREFHKRATGTPGEPDFDAYEAGRRILVWGYRAEKPRLKGRSRGFTDIFIAWGKLFTHVDKDKGGDLVRTLNQPWEWVCDGFDELVVDSSAAEEVRTSTAKREAATGNRARRKRPTKAQAATRRVEKKRLREIDVELYSEWSPDNWDSYDDYARWKNENLPAGWPHLTKRMVYLAIERERGRIKRTGKK